MLTPMPYAAEGEAKASPLPAGTANLDRAGSCPALAQKVAAALNSPSSPVLFEHVTPAAQAFIAALLTSPATSSGRTVWVVCDDARCQERIAAELPTWLPLQPIFLPALEIQHDSTALVDPDQEAARLSALAQLRQGRQLSRPRPLVLRAESLEEPAPTESILSAARLDLALGQSLSPDALVDTLLDAGFERVSQVDARGQLARRGGIVDLFDWQGEHPLRIEFFDEELESLRLFDVHSQISFKRVREASLLLSPADDATQLVPVSELFAAGDLVIAIDIASPADIPIPVSALICSHCFDPSLPEDDQTAAYDHPAGAFDAGDLVVQGARRAALEAQLHSWRTQGWTTTVFCANEGELQRFLELFRGEQTTGLLDVVVGVLPSSFSIPCASLVCLSAPELFGRYQRARHAAAARFSAQERQARRQASLKDLEEGSLVVHLDHGIARYRGTSTETVAGGAQEDVMVLEYAEGARLLVPVRMAHLVSRFVGSGSRAPSLSTLGEGRWKKTRQKVETAVFDFASKLLATQAERQTITCYSHPPDSRWQQEFEASFPYRETVDQLRAIEEVKQDMESPLPMDRLLCGDVGFGKTEVALRAAFKCAEGGRQAVILAPTTVLAQQHFETFRQRMSEYPIKVALLSRSVPKEQQRETLEALAAGSIDVVIGTHRLISKDVVFKQLGLVVIDEEQRFGVRHKELFKERFRLVDVLTLSATPLPRTLYLSLMGVRDMSTLDTPPANRHPVRTTIAPFDERLIKDFVARELQRGGQVYYLHNRVASIQAVARRIADLVEGARVEVGHGQMADGELEKVMERFISGRADVLVCTTIIESGVDIPDANTIIIDRADQFGLADLYQLRGRVGRAQEQAYALLLLPREGLVTGDARRRVTAIRQYSALGSGFKIAMRDLEIRGAGNLLGTEQSGHIMAVGFELYCQMLRQSVDSITGKASGIRQDVLFRSDVAATSEAEFLSNPRGLAPAFLPSPYIPDPSDRIAAYRELATISDAASLQTVLRNWRDRFGPLPDPVVNLARIAEIRVLAAARDIAIVEIKDQRLMLTRKGGYIMLDGKFPRLEKTRPDRQLKEAVLLLKNL